MFEFKRILADGKVLIQVDDNLHELPPEVVRERHAQLTKKLQKGSLDYFETAWIWAYEMALEAMRSNLFAGNGGGHV